MKKGVDYIGVSVGALIFNEKREVFLNKRSAQTRNAQGCWEAPGGAVKFGEKREDATKREVKEEFGVDIEIVNILQTADEILPKDKQHWVTTTYIAKIKEGQKPKILEPDKSDEIGWFSLNNLPRPLSYITQLDIKAFKKRLIKNTGFRPLNIKNPKLRKPCIPVSLRELRTNKMQDLIDKMLNFIYGRSNKGKGCNKDKPMTVGLSANQVGILKRISIVDLAIGRKRFNDIHVLVNPKIIWHSKTTLTNREACINLPEIWGIIRRYKEVKVKACDRSGNKIIIHAKGWSSILLQHEIDHLNGILFIDRLPNPQKAHFVKENETQKYRRNFRRWRKFIDVSKWARKI